jgi:hypothetical protein
MKVPLLGNTIDERFLHHRLRSTSIGGVAGAVAAWGLFLYRLYADGIWSWDLFTVGATVAIVKVAVLVWFRLTD